MSFEIPRELAEPYKSADTVWRDHEYNIALGEEERQKRMREKEINSGIYRERDAIARKRIEENLIETWRLIKDLDWDCKDVQNCKDCPALVPPEGMVKDDPCIVGRCMVTFLQAKFRKR